MANGNASQGARLRRLLQAPSAVAVQGCFDAMSARLAEKAGFEALLLGGFSVEATLLGAPDIGLVTLTELASHAARVTASVNVHRPGNVRQSAVRPN